MHKTIFNYDQLKSRITDLYGTQQAFADAMDWKRSKLSGKLNNRIQWLPSEMTRAADLLGIRDKIDQYFFQQQDQGLHFRNLEDLITQIALSIGIRILYYSDLQPEAKAESLRFSEYGFFTNGNMTFYINDRQPKQERIKTLLHELGHAVLICGDDPRGEEKADKFMNDSFWILSQLQAYQQEQKPEAV